MPIAAGRPKVIKRADKLKAQLDPNYAAQLEAVQRHDLVDGSRQGIYQQNDITNPLFDVCSDNDLASLSLADAYHPLLDIIGWRNTDVYRRVKNVITYIDAAGTGVGAPDTFILDDACEPAAQAEFGTCSIACEGFTSFGSSTPVYNIADLGMRLCEKYPRFRLDGTSINDDYEFGIHYTTAAMLTGIQRWFIQGTGYDAGATEGLAEQIDFGFIDANGQACPANDSCVVDLLGQACLGAAGTGLDGTETVNGVATVTAGFTLIDYISQGLRNIVTRLQYSSWAGQTPQFVGIIDHNMLECLITCLVCDQECGGNLMYMDSLEVKQILNGFRNQTAFDGTVTLNIRGISVRFYTYPFGLDNGDSTSTFFIGARQVGSQKTLGFEAKDWRKAISSVPAGLDAYRITDQNRLLSYTENHVLCTQTTGLMDLRLCVDERWMWMKFENALCTTLKAVSIDPQNPNFFGGQPPTAAPVLP